MDRIKPGYSAVIEAAYNLISQEIHHLIRPDFLTGSNPVLAGLHQWEFAADGRSLNQTAHVYYGQHQTWLSKTQRRTTVVLPVPPSIYTVVHELGHVLHEQVGTELVVDPVTRYAQTNHLEAFAEAFAAWHFPGFYPLPPCDKAQALFETLANGGQRQG